MVKVKIVLAATDHAFAFIPLPDFHLHRCRNKSVVWQFSHLVRFDAEHLSTRNKLEFEDFPPTAIFLPRIEEIEQSSVYPNPVSNLFVYSDRLGRGLSQFRASRRIEERPVCVSFPDGNVRG